MILQPIRTGQSHGQTENLRKGVEEMVHRSGRINKRMLEKTLTQRQTRDRFEDLMGGEFFNGAFKKSLLILHEGPTRKDLSPILTG